MCTWPSQLQMVSGRCRQRMRGVNECQQESDQVVRDELNQHFLMDYDTFETFLSSGNFLLCVVWCCFRFVCVCVCQVVDRGGAHRWHHLPVSKPPAEAKVAVLTVSVAFLWSLIGVVRLVVHVNVHVRLMPHARLCSCGHDDTLRDKARQNVRTCSDETFRATRHAGGSEGS